MRMIEETETIVNQSLRLTAGVDLTCTINP